MLLQFREKNSYQGAAMLQHAVDHTRGATSCKECLTKTKHQEFNSVFAACNKIKTHHRTCNKQWAKCRHRIPASASVAIRWSKGKKPRKGLWQRHSRRNEKERCRIWIMGWLWSAMDMLMSVLYVMLLTWRKGCCANRKSGPRDLLDSLCWKKQSEAQWGWSEHV